MADILLVNARSWTNGPPSYLPYGLLWIAGLLKKEGFSTAIFDRNVDTRDPSEVFLREYPRVIAISCLTGPVINDALMLSALARKELNESFVVWGGIHPTIFPEFVLSRPEVDYVITGEGEFPLLELARYIFQREGSLEEIANLGYKDGKKNNLNPQRDFIDLNILPSPAWELVDINKYIQRKFYSPKVITLNTSRGCPWRCAFCYNQAVNKRRWRGISAERIVEHMDYFSANYGITGFQFYDDEFDVDEKRVIQMCRILTGKRKKYVFGHFSRVNTISLKRLEVEKEAGLRFIEFGIESGSPRILEFIEKDQTTDMIKKAFALCVKAKVKSGALFMLGLPGESEEDVMLTKNLVDGLSAHQTIPTIFKPYPATKLYDYCLKQGLFRLPEDLSRQADIYGLGDFSINTSLVPLRVLKKIYSHFTFRNIRKELFGALTSCNFGLLFYYFKKLLKRIK